MHSYQIPKAQKRRFDAWPVSNTIGNNLRVYKSVKKFIFTQIAIHDTILWVQQWIQAIQLRWIIGTLAEPIESFRYLKN